MCVEPRRGRKSTGARTHVSTTLSYYVTSTEMDNVRSLTQLPSLSIYVRSVVVLTKRRYAYFCPHNIYVKIHLYFVSSPSFFLSLQFFFIFKTEQKLRLIVCLPKTSSRLYSKCTSALSYGDIFPVSSSSFCSSSSSYSSVFMEQAGFLG